MTSLPTDDVVESVAVRTRRDLSPASGEGKVWADLSTISPRVSRELAARVRDEAAGRAMLDTPVSGSVPQVQAGTLTIMVGGDEDAYRRVEPLLRVLGTPEYIGENGQGLVLKLAINISLAVQMLAFSEGLLLAERDGIDPHRAAEVMTESPIGSPMLKARVPLVLDQPDETWFDVSLMHKDIRLALATARDQHVVLPSAGVADQVLTEATEHRLRTPRHRSAVRGARQHARAMKAAVKTTNTRTDRRWQDCAPAAGPARFIVWRGAGDSQLAAAPPAAWAPVGARQPRRATRS